jgi:hypothetical protein
VLGVRRTIVPSCVFPLPAYRRSRRAFGAVVDVAFVEPGAEPVGEAEPVADGVVLAVVGIFPVVPVAGVV